MDGQIDATLSEIEREYECKILVAVESGSRAWGFASPDSDYDVRFVYTHPLNWYIDLRDQRDTIERFFPGEIDCAGWDIRKALRLFAGCNLSFYEWVGSPICYRTEGTLLPRLTELLNDYFNPRKATHHYLGIGRGIRERHLDGNEINIKKLFYILRPLLAASWAANLGTMPPVCFSELLEASLLPVPLEEEIRTLLAKKCTAKEGERTSISSELCRWFDEGFEHLPQLAQDISPRAKPDWEPLNRLFQEMIGFPNARLEGQ